MGYPLDVAAQNASLDALLGDNHATVVPASFQLAIFNASPLAGGVELTSAGGYARQTVTNNSAAFPAASGGRKVATPVSFPVTGAWSDVGTNWVLYAADGVTAWFTGPLSEQMSVDGTETSVQAKPATWWNTL